MEIIITLCAWAEPFFVSKRHNIVGNVVAQPICERMAVRVSKIQLLHRYEWIYDLILCPFLQYFSHIMMMSR